MISALDLSVRDFVLNCLDCGDSLIEEVYGGHGTVLEIPCSMCQGNLNMVNPAAHRHLHGVVLRYKKCSVERFILNSTDTGYTMMANIGPPLRRSDDGPDPFMEDGWEVVAVECRTDWLFRNFGTRATAADTEIALDNSFAVAKKELWDKEHARREAEDREHKLSMAMDARKLRSVGKPIAEKGRTLSAKENHDRMTEIANSILVGGARREHMMIPFPSDKEASNIAEFIEAYVSRKTGQEPSIEVMVNAPQQGNPK